MFWNYIKLLQRNFKRDKGFLVLNMLGLAVGIACAVLIMMWVMDELSYDRFNENTDQLYIVIFEPNSQSTPPPLGPTLKNDFPEIIEFTRVQTYGSQFQYKEKRLNIEDGMGVDPAFLKMFTVNFIRGNAETSLNDTSDIILTESTAKLIFGDEDPLGKFVKVDGESEFKVTGIIEDYPHNSQFKIDYITNFNLLEKRGRNFSEWFWNFHWTYVQTEKSISIDDLRKKIAKVVYDRKPEDKRTLTLRPIVEEHFAESPGLEATVYAFAIAAFVILIIACINFVNLSTARADKRGKEVGIRKTLGGSKKDLVTQFFGESLLITLIAVVIGVVIALLFLPVFNELSGKQFVSSNFLSTQNILGVLVITLIVGLMSGIYPAIFLSSYSPVKVMKGFFPGNRRGASFRKILMVFQFTMSVILIFSTIVIHNQVRYMKTKDLGFSRENIVVTNMGKRLREQYDSFKAEMLRNPRIQSMTVTNCAPYRFESNAGIGSVLWDGKKDQKFSMTFTTVDYDYLKTFGMQMKEGRFFSPEIETDVPDGFVINETAAHMMEMESPVGQKLKIWDEEGIIIGVVEDYNYESLHKTISPMAMRIASDWNDTICLKISPDDVQQTISLIRSRWLEVYPEYEFTYSFLDDMIYKRYAAEDRIADLFDYFMLLAIGISCMGLLGLSAYVAEKRKKEISIRKVLGASLSIITRGLMNEMLGWILLASIIGLPIAFYLMTGWLDGFAYRSSISFWYFLIASGIALITGVITTSYYTIRAVNTNPVDCLKNE
ncbi:MAG: ABC transporter permease [Acidobacteria bacterium]|nr:ABC transporter permease [Acidobacteriota bacterium]